VELQRKDMVSGLFNCDDTEYVGIVDTLGAGIYIAVIVPSMEMIPSGSTRSSVIRGLVPCINCQFLS